MSFTVRPYRRFPVQCAVTYQVDDFEGHDTSFTCPRNAPVLVRYLK
jgi:hypothetical protein